jgi:kynureninase
MLALPDFRRSPNALAPHYARFRVAERLLLTGHSHQAWPDVGFEGQVESWAEAADLVDEKWDRAEAKAARVRRGFGALLATADNEIVLGQNTHELLVRFLSALPLRERPKLVTTDGEFHTIRRQLDRLAEEGPVEVVKVSTEPAAAIAERLVAAVDSRTAAVLVSSVLYANARIVTSLDRVMERCRLLGAELLVDAYHQIGVVPCALRRDGLDGAFVTGGGYKYCQLGEGNCFLRVPPGRAMRPVITGWYAEFAALGDSPGSGVAYGAGPARWAGATYDPTSHYRAARVFDFFDAQGLTPPLLRDVSQHQVGLLARRFDELDLDPAVITRDRTVPIEAFGGFLALLTRHAGRLQAALRRRGVLTDHRGEVLRLGPAPYLSDQQLEAAVAALAEALGEVRQG